jgi:O-antigen/teichoic acid export membrane protein
MNKLSLYISKIVTTVSSFAFNVYLARLADVKHFGVFSLFLNLTFIFILVCDWGQSTIGPLELSKRQTIEDKKTYLRKIINFKLLITVLAVVIYFLIVLLFYGDKLSLLTYGAIMIVINILNFDWLLRANQRFGIISVRLITNGVLNLIFILLLITLKGNFAYVFITYCLAQLAGFLITTIYISSNRLITYHKQFFRSMWSDGLDIFKSTQHAFQAILIFNLVFSLNVPLLSYFSTDEATSFYGSYYALFSSVLSLIIIAQDIYIPLYNKENGEAFFKRYFALIQSGGLCVLLILVAMPSYYHYIFPSTFKINIITAELLGVLGLVYAYRLMYIHSFMIKGDYKLFLLLNLISLVLFIVTTSLFILFQLYNQTTALVSLVIAEVCIVIISFFKGSFQYNKPLLSAVMAIGSVILGFEAFEYKIVLIALGVLLLINLIGFYRKLKAKEISFQ